MWFRAFRVLATSVPVLPPIWTTPSTSDDRPKRRSGGRRWKLIAGGAAPAATAVVGFVVVGADSTDPVEPSVEQRPAYLIIQDEIDKALAERDAPSTEVTGG